MGHTDANSSKSPPVPTGWITEHMYPEAVENMLRCSTGLPATFELAEIAGARYIFSSGKDYYLWNNISTEGWRILNVKSRDDLYTQVG
ncbi:hypothetical protein DEU56DRAFT_174954 [Suillus clintonianus]|uniref:uncharacterized protein n=1 Tax=Suillus clintonianus TaxID=1904413 RepID=UPI001B86A7EE|nr:uncharacterized protein DEU56DRAFT_174954 [Suillus clintonianus]KAG2115506.1 hypothetical protein DEU56DRAFT_174954 [Suillus clintonianus]